MEKLVIEFNGHIEIDRDDLRVSSIDAETGEQIEFGVKNIDTDTIIENIKIGKWYVSLEDNMKHALDGETIIEVSKED